MSSSAHEDCPVRLVPDYQLFAAEELCPGFNGCDDKPAPTEQSGNGMPSDPLEELHRLRRQQLQRTRDSCRAEATREQRRRLLAELGL